MALVIKSATLQKTKPDSLEEWCDYQPGVKFLIRGISHRYVQIGLQAKREKQSQIFSRLDSGDFSALREGKTNGEIGTEMIGELVVADWSGLTLESGEDLDYSEEVATTILSNPDYYDLGVWALAEATRISKEAEKRVNDRLGKSLQDTDGKPQG